MEVHYTRNSKIVKTTLDIYLANYALAQRTEVEKLSNEQLKTAKQKYTQLYEQGN